MQTYYCFIESPVGQILLTSDEQALTGLYMNQQQIGSDWLENPNVSPIANTKRQLAEYFAGTRTTFDIPLAPVGTPFQQMVWRELCNIGYGETISYGELAKRVGNANASRAVGLANGRNPISIIVPCHRVIGVNGKLTGYGGGLSNKQVLLDLEARYRADPLSLF